MRERGSVLINGEIIDTLIRRKNEVNRGKKNRRKIMIY